MQLSAGCEAERKAVHRAFHYSAHRKHKVVRHPSARCDINLQSPDGVTVGDDFTLKVVLKNTVGEVRHVNLSPQEGKL